MTPVQVLAIIGFLISAHTLYVEIRALRDSKYRAWCDFSKSVSCTRAVRSRCGRLLALPNPVFGLAFYALVFLTANLFIVDYLVILGLIASIILAYLSYVKQRNACVLCTSIYIINVLLALLAL